MKHFFEKIREKFQKNDISIRIYISFMFVLVLTGTLIGVIFLQLYQKNYIESYTSLLTKHGKSISKRVAHFDYKEKIAQFQKYSIYIDEIETSEQTDIWILSNKDADSPLASSFTNAEAGDGILTDEMYDVLDKAYSGEIASNSSYDKIYGMMILRVAVPIKNKANGEIYGAVMLVSMIDKQTMGIDEGKYLIMISLFFSIAIAFVVSMAFSRYLSKPINRIGTDIMKLSDGDYSSIKIKKPNSQLGRLEGNLDVLADRLMRAKKEQENINQVRMDFFANVSHELRTPITVVTGFAETLNDGIISDEKMVRELYQRILNECQGMERLVGDLFTLSKMQNPDFEIEMEPVSLVQIFSDVIKNGKIIGREKEIEFVTSYPEDNPCMMLGDYTRLRQMFMVIVDNAVKFSNEGGKINIKILRENDKLKISIQDFGVGISKEELPYIFEKFYKSKLKQNEKGTGLGLMIAKQVALKHGGDIRVSSTLGEGTTFYFEFDECTSIEEYS